WYLFFQAEVGIRGFHVTGVQTCALPIYASATYCFHRALAYYARTEGRLWDAAETHRHLADNHREAGEPDAARKHYLLALEILERSEERRVGRGSGSRWAASTEEGVGQWV